MNNLKPPFQSPAFEEKWGEWIQYRKERKLAKYVPTGLTKTWANLYKISNGDAETACAIIDQSISQNWQGLFQLKSNEISRANITNNASPKLGTSAARIKAAEDF